MDGRRHVLNPEEADEHHPSTDCDTHRNTMRPGAATRTTTMLRQSRSKSGLLVVHDPGHVHPIDTFGWVEKRDVATGTGPVLLLESYKGNGLPLLHTARGKLDCSVMRSPRWSEKTRNEFSHLGWSESLGSPKKKLKINFDMQLSLQPQEIHPNRDFSVKREGIVGAHVSKRQERRENRSQESALPKARTRTPSFTPNYNAPRMRINKDHPGARYGWKPSSRHDNMMQRMKTRVKQKRLHSHARVPSLSSDGRIFDAKLCNHFCPNSVYMERRNRVGY